MAKPGSGKRKMTATWKKQQRRGVKLSNKIFKLINKCSKKYSKSFLSKTMKARYGAPCCLKL